jgi:hypothetical protein
LCSFTKAGTLLTVNGLRGNQGAARHTWRFRDDIKEQPMVPEASMFTEGGAADDKDVVYVDSDAANVICAPAGTT